MQPEFKNDSEIIRALWVMTEQIRENQSDFQIESLKFQAETRNDIGNLKTDVAILKERKSKSFNLSGMFKSMLAFFGIYR